MGIYISDLEIPKDKAVQIVIIRDDGIKEFSQYGIDRAPTIIPAEPCNDLAKPNKRKDGE